MSLFVSQELFIVSYVIIYEKKRKNKEILTGTDIDSLVTQVIYQWKMFLNGETVSCSFSDNRNKQQKSNTLSRSHKQRNYDQS